MINEVGNIEIHISIENQGCSKSAQDHLLLAIKCYYVCVLSSPCFDPSYLATILLVFMHFLDQNVSKTP